MHIGPELLRPSQDTALPAVEVRDRTRDEFQSVDRGQNLQGQQFGKALEGELLLGPDKHEIWNLASHRISSGHAGRGADDLVLDCIGVAEGQDAMVGQRAALAERRIGEQRNLRDRPVLQGIEMLPLAPEMPEGQMQHPEVKLRDPIVQIFPRMPADRRVVAQARAHLGFEAGWMK